MSKKDLNFSANQIIVNIDGVSDDELTLATFSDIPKQDLESTDVTRRESGDKETLEVRKISKTEFEGRFVGIYQAEGKKYPYSPMVVGTDHLEQDNPRNPDQIEFSTQFFALIDIKARRIYISDQRKKNVTCTWISDKLKKDVSVKAILEEKEFIARIKYLESITIAAIPDLFNSSHGTTLSNHLVEDIYGFDAVRASIKFEYNSKRPTDRIIDRIKTILNQKSDYQQVTVVGRDDGNMESILNLDGITSNIKLEIGVDENQMVPIPEVVFEELIKKIKSNE